MSVNPLNLHSHPKRQILLLAPVCRHSRPLVLNGPWALTPAGRIPIWSVGTRLSHTPGARLGSHAVRPHGTLEVQGPRSLEERRKALFEWPAGLAFHGFLAPDLGLAACSPLFCDLAGATGTGSSPCYPEMLACVAGHPSKSKSPTLVVLPLIPLRGGFWQEFLGQKR